MQRSYMVSETIYLFQAGEKFPLHPRKLSRYVLPVPNSARSDRGHVLATGGAPKTLL
jgi:hypothetical protein